MGKKVVMHNMSYIIWEKEERERGEGKIAETYR